MNDIKETIIEQIQQLQRLMFRVAFKEQAGHKHSHYPQRSQARALAILKLKPEISQRELTFLIGKSRQASAELLLKLESRGYIVRKQAEDDKRSVIIQLTEAGLQAADKAENHMNETIEKLNCFSEEELNKLTEMLERLIKQFQIVFPDEDFEAKRQYVKSLVKGVSRPTE